ncbi:hypothetical protein RvVAR031_11580 [Agrobacterium vitis]|nr:hypothetical protein RvVAR031_11580 [Agrobacterium vitis]
MAKAMRPFFCGWWQESGAMCLWPTPLCPAGHLPLKGGDRQETLPTFLGIARPDLR